VSSAGRSFGADPSEADPGASFHWSGITGPKGHFLGFMAAFVNASFSFIGIETVVIAAAEAENPHRSIPKAARRVTYRISFFYILGAILIGMIIDPRDPGLVSGAGNANASPWTLAIKQAGISALPSIVNVRKRLAPGARSLILTRSICHRPAFSSLPGPPVTATAGSAPA
jgi:amino acid permease